MDPTYSKRRLAISALMEGPCTPRELGFRMGMGSSIARYYARMLEREGLVTTEPEYYTRSGNPAGIVYVWGGPSCVVD